MVQWLGDTHWCWVDCDEVSAGHYDDWTPLPFGVLSGGQVPGWSQNLHPNVVAADTENSQVHLSSILSDSTQYEWGEVGDSVNHTVSMQPLVLVGEDSAPLACKRSLNGSCVEQRSRAVERSMSGILVFSDTSLLIGPLIIRPEGGKNINHNFSN